MAKISTGWSFGLNARQALAARLQATGVEESEILAVVFNVGPDADEKAKKKAKRDLHKWMRMPEYAECYKAIVTEIAMPAYGYAQSKIISQINDKSGWLANKAANDVINMYKPIIMGEDSKQITVKIEGMPDMGEPGAEDE